MASDDESDGYLSVYVKFTKISRQAYKSLSDYIKASEFNARFYLN
jgi:hypothetical protein